MLLKMRSLLGKGAPIEVACTRTANIRQARMQRRSRRVAAAAGGQGLLQGKLCLVSGASRGIGRAIAELYASEGARLALVARNKQQLEEVAESCLSMGAAHCQVEPTDLTQPSQTEGMVQRLLQQHDAVDVLVNNAGKMPRPEGPVEGDLAEWQDAMQLNVLAAMHLAQLCIPGMCKRGGGHIVNIGSVAGVEGMKATPVYAATKWALRGWSNSIHSALRGDNIKVLLINPAAVNTPMISGRGFQEERCLQPSDIAEAALFPMRVTAAANPAEMTLRLTLPAMG